MAKDEKHSKKTRARTARAPREHWKEDPDEHDYPAAADYLSLLLDEREVEPVVESLKAAAIVRRKAKDLLRASRLALLAPDDPHVAIDLARVRHGERLSPVLIVRGTLGTDVAMTVADGYHRICASYHLDEDADIPCRLADPPQIRTVPRQNGGRARRRPTTPARPRTVAD